MIIHKKKSTVLIIILLLGLIIITGVIYINGFSEQNIDTGIRKEVKYDGSTDFTYEKPALCEDIRIDYFQHRASYVKNQVVFSGEEDASFNQIKELLKKYDGIIVGYKAEDNFYQVEFLESEIEELKSKARRLGNEDLIKDFSAGLNTDFILETTKSKYSRDKRVEINYTNGIEFDYMTRGKVVTHREKSVDGEELKVQYIENSIRISVDEKYTLDDVKNMAKRYGGVVVGHSHNSFIRNCEIAFLNCDYEKLQEKIKLINDEPMLEGYEAGLRVGYDPSQL